MAPTTQNLQDSRAQNPRRKLLKPFPTHRTRTESPHRSSLPSLPNLEAPSRSLRTKRSCSQALFRLPNSSAEPSLSALPSLPRSRIITLPSSTQSYPASISTMPLTASAETRAWLQERGMGGYLKIIDAPAHPDAQRVGKEVCPEAITNNVLRTAFDLQRGGHHDVDIPPTSKRPGEGAHYRQTGSSFSNTTRVNAGKIKVSVDRPILDYRRVQRDVSARHTRR